MKATASLFAAACLFAALARPIAAAETSAPALESNQNRDAITALQRAGDRPLCVGALNNQEEADRWFPGFSFSELV